MGFEKRSRFSRPEVARFAVGLVGVGAASWLFFTTEDALIATFWLIASLAAGEIGGNAVAKCLERHDRTRNE